MSVPASSTGLRLSKQEIREMTGTPQKKRQAAFLRKNGIRHYLDLYDWPVVLRSAVENIETAPANGAIWKPNKGG